jgi:hypothetical protein
MKVPCDSNSPTEIQVHHPDAVEGTFHSCSSHLHELLTFFSVDKKNMLAKRLNLAPFQMLCNTVYANKFMPMNC